MAVSDAHVFPGFLIPVLTQLFLLKPPSSFLTCSAEVRGENLLERKFALTGDRGHESDTLTTEPPRWGNQNSGMFDRGFRPGLSLSLRDIQTQGSVFTNHS